VHVQPRREDAEAEEAGQHADDAAADAALGRDADVVGPDDTDANPDADADSSEDSSEHNGDDIDDDVTDFEQELDGPDEDQVTGSA
jgi:hypothetical protein